MTLPQIKSYLFEHKKKLISIAVPLLLLIAIPVTFYLSQNPQVFRGRATGSQTYSVVTFDSKVEQNLDIGDTLTGNGIPEAKVTISITPNGVSSDVTADAEGNWSYQIPNELPDGNYNLTISLKDILGNLASIKTYPITVGGVEPNNHNLDLI